MTALKYARSFSAVRLYINTSQKRYFVKKCTSRSSANIYYYVCNFIIIAKIFRYAFNKAIGINFQCIFTSKVNNSGIYQTYYYTTILQ